MNGVLHFKQTEFLSNGSAPIMYDGISDRYYLDQYMIRYYMSRNMAEALNEWWRHLELNPRRGAGFNSTEMIKASDWFESLSEDQKEQVKRIDINDLKPIKFVSKIRREFLIKQYEKWLPEKEHPRTEEKGFDYDQLIIRDANFFYSGSTNQIWFSLDNYFRNVAYETNDPDCRPTISDWYDQLSLMDKANITRTPR